LTLGELIDRTERRLRAARLHYGHGTDNPRDEAAFLVLRGHRLPFDADLARPADVRRIEPLIRQRIDQRLPAAYILREAWLDGTPFYVDRRVIVPRSHIAFLFPELGLRPRHVLDLCTGSGCLAILAARAFPRAQVDASDISPDALAVARRNVRRHRMEKRVRLLRTDLLAGTGVYDLIVSNPPYVSTRAMRRLPPEYRQEPGIALGGGADGLQFVSRILQAAPRHLGAQGVLVCEVGENRKAVERAYPRVQFTWPRDEAFVLPRARMPGASRSAPRRARGA
jgi:ribosomal protein L3 glutamine methyltransferase